MDTLLIRWKPSEGKPVYEFMNNVKISEVIGGNIQLLQTVRELKDVFLYCDEEGMHKRGLGMNIGANPFIPERMLRHLAGYGGPLGDLVLHSEDGPLDTKILLDLCKKWDTKYGEDYESYEEPMLLAISKM